MEWKLELGADLSHAALRLSIQVNLPRQRRERIMVVFRRFDLNPRQAIAALHASGRADAQRAVTIVDTDL